VYVSRDHAFDFLPADTAIAAEREGTQGRASIVLDTLQVEVSVETGLCLWVSGYCPTTGWSSSAVEVPSIEPGGLSSLAEGGLRPGVGVRATDGVPKRWFDPSTGWFCATGRGDLNLDAKHALEIATDTIITVSDNRLIAVFVRPRNWKDLSHLF
jgi:hypothetical protein